MSNNKTPISVGTSGGGGGSGTITTGANVGTGAQVYKGVNLNALEFRTLLAEAPLGIDQEAEEIRIRLTEDMATQAELDAVEAVAYTAAEVALSTGVIEVPTETFNLTRLSASTLRVSAIAKVVFEGDVTNYSVPQTDLNVSTMLAGLPTGTYIKHLHLQKPNTFLFLNARTVDTPNLMPLGTILVLSNGTAVTIATEVDPLPQPGIAAVNLYALENAPARIELTTGPNADLTLFAQSGYYYGEAVNWANRNNIYKYPIAADNILSFRYVSPAIAVSSSVNPEVTSVDPTKYWNGTALVDVPAANNATIQRLAWVPLLRSFAIQYGEVVYSNLQAAINALAEDSFTSIFAGSQAIEIARFAVQKSATNLQNNAQCIYVVAGESLGGVTGGSGGNTNLSTTRDAVSVTITSDTGNDALIPAASATEAGVLTAADKSKLDGIAPGAQVNVPTNLSITYSLTNILISSSTGTDITVDPADSDSAGLLTAADKVKLDGIQAGAQVNVPTDLSITYTATNAQINSSTGLDATFNTATTSNAGLMSAADKSKLDGLSGGGGGGTGDVVGPASSTNNGIPVFDGVTGKLLKQASNATLESGVFNGLDAINNGALTGFKNKIHNWAMEVNQRGGPFSITALSNIVTLDRWKINNISGQTATVEQVVDAPSSYVRLVNSLKLTTTSAMASVPANNLIRLTQVVEGLDLRGLRGLSSILSFHVKSSKTGTYCISVRNAGTDRYLLGTFTVNAANTWELKSFVVPNVVTAGGTWDYGTGVGLEISWILAAGTDYQDISQKVSWTTGNKLSLASQVNLFDTNGATFQITGVQLQGGVGITTFEDRPPSVELALCQRYAERTSISTLVSQASQTSIQTYSCKVNKRATPIISGTAGYQNNVASSNFQDLGTSGYRHILGATAAGAAEWTGEVLVSADF